jgi:hypothetical protein
MHKEAAMRRRTDLTFVDAAVTRLARVYFQAPIGVMSDSPDRRFWGAGLAETVYCCRRCCRPNPTARNATLTAAALRNKVCEPHGIADRTSTYNWPQLANWWIKRNKNMIDLVLFFNSRSSLVLPDVTVPHPRHTYISNRTKQFNS